jgi:hypothetical protein
MKRINPQDFILRENIKEHKVVDELQKNPRFEIPDEYKATYRKLRKRATDEQTIRKYYAGYLAATLALDDYLGELIKTLEKLPPLMVKL